MILLLFDLPNETKEERREYTAFRKYLRRSGYFFIQKSVYVKMLCNVSSFHSELSDINEKAPKNGSVSLLPMNLNTFRNLQTVRGSGFDVDFFTSEILFL